MQMIDPDELHESTLLFDRSRLYCCINIRTLTEVQLMDAQQAIFLAFIRAVLIAIPHCKTCISGILVSNIMDSGLTNLQFSTVLH